ncbi:MAG: hypothetical protein M1829_003802 [Trizodia sp. TS-e1964]|nr:MAG: hypothetical protein M1829_003802 [Trizodia sp. TS-e1964]
MSLLIKDQFENNFFGPVNLIKTAIPLFRRQNAGHIIAISDVGGQLGIPALGMHCASSAALEGFCDTLTYEVAPFNIKVSIVQPPAEVNLLTNTLTCVSSLPCSAAESNPSNSVRAMLVSATRVTQHVSNKLEGQQSDSIPNRNSKAQEKVSTRIPDMAESTESSLLAETVYALAAIGGHSNPPSRHIVGFDAAAMVKEKVKCASEDLEEFAEPGTALDMISAGRQPAMRELDMDGSTRPLEGPTALQGSLGPEEEHNAQPTLLSSNCTKYKALRKLETRCRRGSQEKSEG